jgi:predicted negative regulator of RcsB-dependent stress response
MRAGSEDPRAVRALVLAGIVLVIVGLVYLAGWQRERARKEQERAQYQAVMQEIQRRTGEATRSYPARTPLPVPPR